MGWRCVLMQRYLALYVGDDLSEAETQSVETHLKSCESCRQLVEALAESRQLFTQCQSNALEPLSDSVWPALANQLCERRVSRRRSKPVWLPVGAMVAASVAIGVVLWNRPTSLPPVPGAFPGAGSASSDWNGPDWASQLTLPTKSEPLRNDRRLRNEPHFHLETAVPAGLSDDDL